MSPMTSFMSRSAPLLIGLACFLVIAALPALPALAQVGGIPAFNVSEGEGGSTYSLSLQILALMTALSLLPSLVLGMTSFTRIIIVLSLLRQAMGTQQTPPNQVLLAIALFLTLFIMAPTFSTLNADVIGPYLDGAMPAEQALANGAEVMKRFLVQNTRVNDLIMFTDMVGDQPYASAEDVPLNVLLPAFITSELKTAFQIGFLLFLPFPCDRHGDRLHADVAWHDDAEPDAGVASLQASAVCPGRWLGDDCRIACRHLSGHLTADLERITPWDLMRMSNC